MRLTRSEFLEISPRELDLHFEEQAAIRRESWQRAALVCAVLANVHRGEDIEPYSVDDFMPGAEGRKSDEEDMRDFVEQIQRGEKFEADPEALAALKNSLVRPEPKSEILRKPCST